MMDARKPYDDLIEISACAVAFSDLTGRALPRRIYELISEAADLHGAWAGFSADGKPGTAELPIVDAVIDEVFARANALRVEIFGDTHRAAEHTTDAFAQAKPPEIFRETLDGLAAQMREHLGRFRGPH